MRQRCIENPQRIVLPEAHDHRIIEAAGAAQSKGIANVVLLGDKETIQQVQLCSMPVMYCTCCELSYEVCNSRCWCFLSFQHDEVNLPLPSLELQ